MREKLGSGRRDSGHAGGFTRRTRPMARRGGGNAPPSSFVRP
jgi:hypothetical protein